MNPIPVVTVAGPTASGKTKLAVELCKLFNGEVVSADSMQIYDKMDIATAKPSVKEMENIPHHLIGFLQPEEDFSVAQYCAVAKPLIKDISGRGKLPVIAGGTGLYIDSLLYDTVFPEAAADAGLRERLKEKAKTGGAESLLEELRQADAETAGKLHPNNLGRIIRALEVFYTTGIPMSRHVEMSRANPSPFRACMIGLNFRDRQVIYDRINKRVDEMLENGLLDEAKRFIKGGRTGTARQAIGYKELEPYFDGLIPLPEAIENLKRETRHYAKRQLTWFGRNNNIQWIYADDWKDQNGITQRAAQIINESGIAGGELHEKQEPVH